MTTKRKATGTQPGLPQLTNPEKADGFLVVDHDWTLERVRAFTALWPDSHSQFDVVGLREDPAAPAIYRQLVFRSGGCRGIDSIEPSLHTKALTRQATFKMEAYPAPLAYLCLDYADDDQVTDEPKYASYGIGVQRCLKQRRLAAYRASGGRRLVTRTEDDRFPGFFGLVEKRSGWVLPVATGSVVEWHLTAGRTELYLWNLHSLAGEMTRYQWLLAG